MKRAITISGKNKLKRAVAEQNIARNIWNYEYLENVFIQLVSFTKLLAKLYTINSSERISVV